MPIDNDGRPKYVSFMVQKTYLSVLQWLKNVDSFIVGPSAKNQLIERMSRDVPFTFYYTFYNREDGQLFTIDNHINLLAGFASFISNEN